MSSIRPCARGLRHWHWFAAASWLASLLLYLTLPPSPDQFSHAYMGWRLLEGDIPYRDFFDQNWPGVAGLHALAIALFGINLWSWRAFDFLLFAACAIALSDLARLAVNRGAQRTSLILLPLIYVGANYWVAGQQDMTAAQFLAIAIWIYASKDKNQKLIYNISCGLLIAFAILNKPSAAIIALILPLQTLWLKKSRGAALAQAVAMLSTIAIVLFITLCALLIAGTTSQDLVDQLYTFTLARRELRDLTSIELLLKIFSGVNHPWWYPSLVCSIPAGVWFLQRRTRTAAGVALVSLWLTGIISYIVQGSGVGYHLAPAFIAMAAANAASIYLVGTGRIRFGPVRWQQSFSYAFVAFAIAVASLKLVASYYSLPGALIAGTLTQHLSRFPSGNGDVTVADTLDFIHRLPPLAPSDCILSVGNDSALNYLSHHAQPTRFYYFDVLLRTGPALPMAKRWIEYWAHDLANARCPIVLISHDASKGWLSLSSPAPEALRAFLTNYQQVGILGGKTGDIVFERIANNKISN